MSIYRYNADLECDESQEIIIVAESPEEALKKLKAYLEKERQTELAIKADISDLQLETDDVFQTFGYTP
jgi:hypothetical protein